MRIRTRRIRYTAILPSSGPSLFQHYPQRWHVLQAGASQLQAPWAPPTDVYETEKVIYVLVEIAGVQDEHVEVEVFHNALCIEGFRRLPQGDETGVYRVAEIHQGAFHIDVPLPADVDPHKTEAALERGILRVTLPKMAVGEDK